MRGCSLLHPSEGSVLGVLCFFHLIRVSLGRFLLNVKLQLPGAGVATASGEGPSDLDLEAAIRLL